MRWVGHDLLAEVEISAEPHHSLPQAHHIAEAVRHWLLHRVRRLADATVHVSPRAGTGVDVADPHGETSHHFTPPRPDVA
jgi:divalent metal cation (Fe/Co/Zn/Cd) transporter